MYIYSWERGGLSLWVLQVVKTSSLFCYWRVAYCIYSVFHTCTVLTTNIILDFCWVTLWSDLFYLYTLCFPLLSGLFTGDTFSTCARSLTRDIAHVYYLAYQWINKKQILIHNLIRSMYNILCQYSCIPTPHPLASQQTWFLNESILFYDVTLFHWLASS